MTDEIDAGTRLDQAATVIANDVARFNDPALWATIDLESLVSVYLTLVDAAGALAETRDDLADVIAHAMQGKRDTIAGVTLERHAKSPRRTDWDHEGLLRLVTDSRVVDHETGEIASVLDVLKKVYPLKGYNARVTALRDLGIDVDEFCRTESTDRMTLRIHKSSN
jgi:hypothetical protein